MSLHFQNQYNHLYLFSFSPWLQAISSIHPHKIEIKKWISCFLSYNPPFCPRIFGQKSCLPGRELCAVKYKDKLRGCPLIFFTKKKKSNSSQLDIKDTRELILFTSAIHFAFIAALPEQLNEPTFYVYNSNRALLPFFYRGT